MPSPCYADNTATVYHGDCLDVLRAMPAESVHAVVTDPPYELAFMGRAWDASGIAFNVDVWRECLRVLKPGGYLLAFGGSRTWHRLAVAIEDAGFEMRDSIAWLYGSGFPKSMDVSKAIDKRGGNPGLAADIAAAIKAARESRGWTTGQADRHFCNGSTNWTWFEGRKAGIRPPTPADFARIVAEWSELAPWAKKVAEADREVVGQKTSGIGTAFGDGEWASGKAEHVDITAPATPAAQQWSGWGTALKPAFEPIVVARKPLSGTVAANVLEHGTGALNIDGCRVGATGGGTHCTNRDDAGRCRGHANAGRSTSSETFHGPDSAGGRWPTNVVLDGDAADELDEQSGITRSKSSAGRQTPKRGTSALGDFVGTDKVAGHDDSGGASRFFPVFGADEDEHHDECPDCRWENDHPPFRYQAKAPAKERPKVDGIAHPTVKPLALMRWLVRLVTPPGGTVLDPFLGSGTTAQAARDEGFRCIGIESHEPYIDLIRARLGVKQDAPPLFDLPA